MQDPRLLDAIRAAGARRLVTPDCNRSATPLLINACRGWCPPASERPGWPSRPAGTVGGALAALATALRAARSTAAGGPSLAA